MGKLFKNNFYSSIGVEDRNYSLISHDNYLKNKDLLKGDLSQYKEGEAQHLDYLIKSAEKAAEDKQASRKENMKVSGSYGGAIIGTGLGLGAYKLFFQKYFERKSDERWEAFKKTLNSNQVKLAKQIEVETAALNSAKTNFEAELIFKKLGLLREKLEAELTPMQRRAYAEGATKDSRSVLALLATMAAGGVAGYYGGKYIGGKIADSTKDKIKPGMYEHVMRTK